MPLFKKNKKKTAAASPQSKSTDSAATWVEDIRYGRSVSIEFFRHNSWLLLIFLVAIIALIGMRYETKTKMEQIKKLSTELKRAESLKLQEKSKYMSLIRETEMRRLVEEKHLGLRFQEQPPYELILDN